MSNLLKDINQEIAPKVAQMANTEKRLYVFEKNGKRETQFAESFPEVFKERPDLKSADFKAIHKTL
jgi:hypothetical protein